MLRQLLPAFAGRPSLLAAMSAIRPPILFVMLMLLLPFFADAASADSYCPLLLFHMLPALKALPAMLPAACHGCCCPLSLILNLADADAARSLLSAARCRCCCRCFAAARHSAADAVRQLSAAERSLLLLLDAASAAAMSARSRCHAVIVIIFVCRQPPDAIAIAASCRPAEASPMERRRCQLPLAVFELMLMLLISLMARPAGC